MKLAEALQQRADIKRDIDQLRYRLSNNALIQEGEKPAENPDELLAKLNEDIILLEQLTTKINLTNCSTIVEGKSLTALISQKDALQLKISAYQDLVSSASRTVSRATRSEIKIVSAVDVKKIQKEVDSLSKQLRLLDNLIQQTNWTIDLN